MSDLIKLLGESPYQTLTKTVNQHAGVLNGLVVFAVIAGVVIAVLLADALLSARRIRKLTRRIAELEKRD